MLTARSRNFKVRSHGVNFGMFKEKAGKKTRERKAGGMEEV